MLDTFTPEAVLSALRIALDDFIYGDLNQTQITEILEVVFTNSADRNSMLHLTYNVKMKLWSRQEAVNVLHEKLKVGSPAAVARERYFEAEGAEVLLTLIATVPNSINVKPWVW